MTRLLEKAISEMNKLVPKDQDAIASLILEELLDDAKWDEEFARSQNQLAKLAQQARKDVQAGRA